MSLLIDIAESQAFAGPMNAATAAPSATLPALFDDPFSYFMARVSWSRTFLG
ncbi:MAG: hypothetical protein KC994_21805 [Candidatus Omnitrophica bacterium]|nr:hypothetical protein [Candidatus Omnitrophota bacterium]